MDAPQEEPTLRNMLSGLTQHVERGMTLTAEEVRISVAALADPGLATETKAAFLTALARKGETPEEITAFAGALRAMAIAPPIDDSLRAGGLLDVVGTGGDHACTFNVSTGSALIAAAAGVKVAKHGNRAVTSQTGSADVLEALGIPVDQSPEQAVASLRTNGFAFFFAPRYHPAFAHIGPARRLCAARGQRTLFNLLGPLLNPAQPTAELMGVAQPEWCDPMAHVLQMLGLRRGMVVCGAVPAEEPAAPQHSPARTTHIDELSTLGETTMAEFYQDRGFHLTRWQPEGLPLRPARLADLQGGGPADNAAILRRLFGGQDRGPKRDALLLNAGTALFVAGRVRTITEGWHLAAETIDTGQAEKRLRALAGR